MAKDAHFRGKSRTTAQPKLRQGRSRLVHKLDETVTLLVSTLKMTRTSDLMDLSRTDVSNQPNVLL